MINEQNSITDLKAMAFDLLRSIEQAQRNLQGINQLINQKESENKEKPPEKAPK